MVFQRRKGEDISSVRPAGERVRVVGALGRAAVQIVVLVIAENEKREEAAFSNGTTKKDCSLSQRGGSVFFNYGDEGQTQSWLRSRSLISI